MNAGQVSSQAWWWVMPTQAKAWRSPCQSARVDWAWYRRDTLRGRVPVCLRGRPHSGGYLREYALALTGVALDRFTLFAYGRARCQAKTEV